MTKSSLSRALLGTFAASVLCTGMAFAQASPTPGAQGTQGTSGTVDRATQTKTTETKTREIKETTATGTQPATTISLTDKEARAAKPVLQDIHKVNQLEIALGNLATEKATSQSVKDYAQMLVTDHQAADKKVMDFANANNIMLATMMPATREQAPSTATDPAMRPPAGTTAGVPTPSVPGAPTPGAAAPPAGTPGGAASDASPMAAAQPAELDAQGKRTLAKLEKLEGVKFEKAYLTQMVNGHAKTAAKLKTAEKRAQNPELKTLVGDIRATVETHLEKAKELQKAGSS
jgi:predicted outer membrane protein